MSARISPAKPPYPQDIQARLDKVMPSGVPPLTLFRMLARDTRLFERFMGGGLLDKGHLALRQREIVIDRVTARCGSEYEWGVHIAFFGERA
ncbi:MAG: carboxymuconolactone decarboxylase family protein, partial [Hyphomicrobium sp.]|nr:carboxymuconolactone decarboxylase family protein [Hyphomicrobium sp.]